MPTPLKPASDAKPSESALVIVIGTVSRQLEGWPNTVTVMPLGAVRFALKSPSQV